MNTLMYWIALPMVANILVIVFVVFALRRLTRRMEDEAAEKAAERVLGLLNPLLNQARELSLTFDTQLREKQRLIQSLNEHLDRRITALNLLVNRTEAAVKSAEQQRYAPNPQDMQEAVLNLADQGRDTEHIARALSVSPGEVSLILDLKRKLNALSSEK